MKAKSPTTFHPTSIKAWRAWLQKNHVKELSVWVIYYKVKSGKPTISWSEAVDEALCFGWIDSTRKSLDEHTFTQFYTKRKPSSTWSKINKEKVEKLIAEGRMSKAGLACIELAKQNGSWSILDSVEELIIPEDLEQAFKTKKGSKDFFLSLSRSVRKRMLQWLVLARREETRQNRVQEIAEMASKKQKPKQFQ